MRDISVANNPLQKEIARLTLALASVDSGDFYGAYSDAEVAAMRTSLQRLKRTFAGHQARGGK
jgi:hypothetical protein